MEAPMGLAQQSSPILDQSSPEQAPPIAASDDQSLYGNAFVGAMFGEKPEVARSGLDDVVRSAVDQVSARAELEGKFDTENGLGSEGRAPISEDELDEMVELYSDIRLGKTNLKLDTAGLSDEDAEAFRKGAMGDMATMMQTESGRKLLRDLAYNEKGIQTSVGRSVGADKPVTEGYLEPERDCSESYKRDRPGDPNGWCIDDRAHDGKGVDSQVKYRPGETTITDDGESRSDVTLYHELAHSLHNMKGDQARGSSGGIGNDEFQATGLGKWAYPVDDYGDLVPNENLYRSERRDLGEDMDDRRTYGGQSP